jgi:hypothetical protein
MAMPPPDRTGPIGRPVEFGNKAQVVDNDDGVVLDHASNGATPPRDRARLDHLDGARIWTGHGYLAHNLVKIAALAGWSTTQPPPPAPAAHFRSK